MRAVGPRDIFIISWVQSQSLFLDSEKGGGCGNQQEMGVCSRESMTGMSCEHGHDDLDGSDGCTRGEDDS